MGKIWGLTLLVFGAGFLYMAIHLWHGKKREAAGQQGRVSKTGWHATVILLLTAGGLGLGGGASLLFGLDFLYARVGFVPLWSVIAALPGLWFIGDVATGRRGWTRTSAMMFLSALVIAVPIAPPALSAGTHGQPAPQTVSVTHKGKG
jgi:hypothetical protein